MLRIQSPINLWFSNTRLRQGCLTLTKTVARHSRMTDSVVVLMSQDACNFAGIRDWVYWVYTSTRIERERARTLIVVSPPMQRTNTFWKRKCLSIFDNWMVLMLFRTQSWTSEIVLQSSCITWSRETQTRSSQITYFTWATWAVPEYCPSTVNLSQSILGVLCLHTIGRALMQAFRGAWGLARQTPGMCFEFSLPESLLLPDRLTAASLLDFIALWSQGKMFRMQDYDQAFLFIEWKRHRNFEYFYY
jgi:hypothetical protein